MDEEEYLEIQEDDSEDEDNPDQKQASSFAEKGREVMKKWMGKLKPETSNVPSIINSDDSYLMTEEDFSLQSGTFYEEEEEEMEEVQTKEILDRLCRDKTFMMTEKPVLQVRMVAGEEHSNIPNVIDELEENESVRPRKATSHFPIPEWVEIKGEWRYKYEMVNGTYTTKQP